ncbi:MAG: thioredoxin fold domain-containing protein [Candidatus Eisenbacteria bacterium]|nr:thioredoxin fold domain-containing protein [Candidatus Latescibacterota bacterium]MBD3302319.1 thioredoxin fold domain-containing protein [Candidatus Eisenbacteria bacterium]
MMRWTAGLLLLLVLVVAGVSWGIEGLDMGGGPPEVPVQAYAARDGVVPGERLPIAVVYELPPDHHIQVNDFLYVEPAEGEPFTIGERRLPPTRTYEGEPVLLGRVVVRADLILDPETPLGEMELALLAGFQACSERPIFACFAPEEKRVTIPIRVVEAGSPIQAQHAQLFAAPSSAAPDEPSEEAWLEEAEASGVPDQEELGVQEGLAAKLRGALARGSWIAFLLVFTAGFLTSFTPCVYPMIPITIGFVAGRSQGKLSGFVLSLFFVLGIAIVYSTLGLAAALGGGVFGAALQSTAAVVFIAVVFGVMGISMLGAFDIALPSGLQTKMATGRRGGFAGAVLMGGVTGLVASPCVGPVLVVLLTWVAQVGRPVYGFTLLFTFAVGLGLLFLLLGTFVGAMKALPKAGQWMEDVKHYFGWIFLFLAVFFLRTEIGPAATRIAYGVLLILFASQIGAFRFLPASAHGGRWSKGFGIVFLVLGITTMTDGLATQFGWKEVLRSGSGGPVAGVEGTLQWRTDETAALADAREAGKPVLLDFTAEWCAACHELDEKTWVEPRVASILQDFVLLRLDMTDRSPETQALGERWNVTGLPTVIVLDGEGNEVDRFFGFRSADQVLPLLRRAG